MADDQDNEKTEEPTHKRIQDAMKRGQVAFSRELANLFMLFVLAATVLWFIPFSGTQATLSLARFIAAPHDIPVDSGALLHVMTDTVGKAALWIALPVLAALLAAFAASLLQNGFFISGESLVPKLDKISPISGLRRLFSMRTVVEFLKGLLKITVVGIVAWIVVRPELSRLEAVIGYSIPALLTYLGEMAFRIVLGVCIVMFVLALMDVLYQRFEYLKSLRMTRQELKDEYKESEGDPQIKAKLRQIRADRVRRRMMAAVPKADVVIRNPTHYAIALQYDEAVMRAPMVIAKGKDLVALKIIEIAEAHKVPTVLNPPLARALFTSTELEEEIPLEHYQAVAEVIGYVYRLQGKKKMRA